MGSFLGDFMEIIVKAPASCGELVEGILNGTPFLVTAPISMYAVATVSDTFSGVHGLGEKAEEAMARTLAHIGQDSLPYGIRLDSAIPQGKGMASSSADIAAVSYAVARALGRELTGREIMDIAIAIEPSDGIALTGLSHVSHTTGELFGQYFNVPLLAVSIFDVGGTVDTTKARGTAAIRMRHTDSCWIPSIRHSERMDTDRKCCSVRQLQRAHASIRCIWKSPDWRNLLLQRKERERLVFS